MIHLILTLIGPDRPGLVESVAALIASHGGNWLESRMTRLGGKFAGVLRAELPVDAVSSALHDLTALESKGLRVVVETEVPAAVEVDRRVRMELNVVGVDRPGIVRELTQLLAAAGINVEDLSTERQSAPMSGEILFEARALIHLPPSTDLAALRAQLERASKDLMVDVRLDDVTGRPSAI